MLNPFKLLKFTFKRTFLGGLEAVCCRRGKLFLDQSIGIDKTNTFQLKSSIKIVGATGLAGLWALKWAWQTFFKSIDRY